MQDRLLTILLNVSSTSWDEQEAADYLNKMAKKHMGRPLFKPNNKGGWWVTPAWSASIDKMLGSCDSLKMDPELYIEAQFVMLSRMIAAVGTLYPNTIIGKNAIQRYDWFCAQNKRKTFNVRGNKGDITDPDILSAEIMYGELVVKTKMLNIEVKPNELVEMVKENYPDWSPDDPKNSFARLKALPIIGDAVIPRLSRMLVINSETFTWEQVADLLIQLNPAVQDAPVDSGDLDGITLESYYAKEA